MKKMFGWVGKILRVDLTKEEVTDISTGRYVPKYVGGRQICARIYWEEVPEDVDAFAAENKLFFITGPLTGTPSPSSGRIIVVGKSPQTFPQESYAKSSVGGHWGSELKFAGYDGVILQGKASRPVYLWIQDGNAKIWDAEFIWGLDTYTAQKELLKRHGKEGRVLLIGPAGEKLVRTATIQTDSTNTAGQGGFGAVMGSKKLKGIIVRGTGSVKIARAKELLEYVHHLNYLLYGNRKQKAQLPGFVKGKLYDEVQEGKGQFYNAGCHSCPQTCMAALRLNDNSVIPGACKCLGANGYAIPEQHYYGGKIFGRASWAFIMMSNLLGLSVCDYSMRSRSGDLRMAKLDPMDNPQVAAPLLDGSIGLDWLYECHWRGILTKENTGLPWNKFGSKEFIEKLLTIVANREGFGHLLAEGVARCAHKLGREAFEIYKKHYARAGKFGGWHNHHFFCKGASGNEGCITPMNIIRAAVDNSDWSSTHSVHFVWTHKINLAGVKPFSDEYWKIARLALKKWFGTEKVIDNYNWGETAAIGAIVDAHFAIERDSLPLCDFLFPIWFSPHTKDRSGDVEAASKLFSYVTGINRTENEMLFAAERTVNLERAIAVREGRTRADDVFWDWWYRVSDYEGRTMDKEVFDRTMDEFYKLRKWDITTGIPTRAKLEELGLNDVADEIERLSRDNSLS